MLIHLVLRTLRMIAWVTLFGCVLGASAATVRILPWLAAPDVPVRVSLAFLYTLWLAAAEVALFVAAPIAASLEVARWEIDGTAATLRTLGVGPARQAANAGVACATASLLCLAVSAGSAASADAPGELSNALIRTAATHVCQHDRVARVPLADVSWLCLAGTPTLAGRFPARGPASIGWTAANARFSRNLGQIELEDVRVATDRPSVTIHVQHAVIQGLVPWLVPAGVHAPLRATTTAVVSWLAALACAWALLRWPSPSRARALAAAVTSTLGFLLFGAAMIQRTGWTGVALASLAAVAPPIAFVRASAWLPPTVPNGTKRLFVRTARAEDPDG